MITRMQMVFHGSDIARVFRFRLAVMAASMLVWSAAATPLLNWLGSAGTELLCGLLIVAIGAVGYAICRRIEDRDPQATVSPAHPQK
jgi:hypothetical protein